MVQKEIKNVKNGGQTIKDLKNSIMFYAGGLYDVSDTEELETQQPEQENNDNALK